MTERIIEAELTWTGSRFERGVRIAVGAAGTITAVGRKAESNVGPPTERLPGRALLPGFVNAHSHAFQRGLRGRGEVFPAGAGSFWTWREAMYELVERLDPAAFRSLCTRAFREMRRAGITAVGEFHYLHHGSAEGRFDLDEIVIESAAEAGIRLVLLQAHYRQGGIGRPLEGGQRRFDTGDPASYWEQIDRLAEHADGAMVRMGCVAHSIRAVEPDEVALLQREAHRRGMVMHLHLEEQPAEIEACRAAYGRTPMALVNELLDVDASLVAVHCTHTDPEDMARFLGAGGRVCICPLTEANLGDGIPDTRSIIAAGGRVALGTDSNARISMLEEMRWLEYGQRLRGGMRGALVDETGEVATTLLRCGTLHGAEAIGIPAGAIEAGRWADFVAVDLAAPTLEGWDDATLPAGILCGAAEEVIAATCVGGRWSDGPLP